MSRWLAKNVPRDSYLLVSYFALNEDGFREWIESAGVEVPTWEELKEMACYPLPTAR